MIANKNFTMNEKEKITKRFYKKLKKSKLKLNSKFGKKYFLQGIWIRVNKWRSTKWIDVC